MKNVKTYIHIDSAGSGKTPDGMIDFKKFMDQEKSVAEPLVEVDSEDIAQLAYTSGTEALPKGVMQTHRGLISQYVSSIVGGELRTDDTATVTMPLFHCAQVHCFSGPHVYLGATQIIMPGFDPVKMLETIQKEKVTFTFGLPAQYRAMLAVPDFEKYDLGSLRMCTYAMAPVSVQELKVFMGKFKPKRGFQIYFGQTEMSPVTTILNPEEHAFKEGSVGKAVLNVEMAIMDDDGKIMPSGEIGEIVYKGGHTMKGYLKDEEKTREAFKYGWFHSGDLARMDEEGYIWFEDRKKDMIKSGGENVASIEVEKCIYNYPDVQEVAVVGLPDPRWIERVAALVVPKPGAKIEPEGLIDYCKNNLAGYKVPKQVEIVNEIPKTATGKVRKNIIRQTYASK
jgi:fatty-acyl-CoA synthase